MKKKKRIMAYFYENMVFEILELKKKFCVKN